MTLTIVVTHTSSPTCVGTLHSLREAFDCRIIGIDASHSYDKHLLDGVYTEDRSAEGYIQRVIDICKKESSSIVIPHSISERILFMENESLFVGQGISILSSSAESIKTSESKLAFLSLCKELNIPVGEYHVASTYKELKEFVYQLGYPAKKVVVKPVEGSGSRGFRILNKRVNFRRMFSSHRPDHPETTLSNLHSIIGDKFAPLIVSEFLPGEEYTVDGLCIPDHELYVVRERVETKNGLTTVGKVVEHKEIEEYSKKLTRALGLTTVFGFQFKADENGQVKALECNPRIQGTMVMSTMAGANIIAACIAQKLALPMPSLTIDKGMIFYRLYGGMSVGKTIKRLDY